MNREILFRGKRIKLIGNDEWVEGYIGKYFDGFKTVTCIAWPTRETITGSLCYDVDPATVGQYTGLTDKNGKKIFEGDILGLTCTEYPQYKLLFSVHFGPYEIGNEEDEYCVVGWHTKGVGRSESWGEYSLFADAEKANLYYEVIGNIHDNPGLLEGD